MIETIVILILIGLNWWQFTSRRSRDIQHTAELGVLQGQVNVANGKLNIAINDYEQLVHMLQQKSLTNKPPAPQDGPKRLSSPQLRRMNDAVNAADTAALIERPNSEILKEYSNGGRDA